MRYGLTVKTAPQSQPITVPEAKSHARVTGTADDSDLSDMIDAARAAIEERLSRALISTQYTLTLDHFPGWPIEGYNESALDLAALHAGYGAPIRLPRSPVQTVDEIRYIDTDGTQQTLAANKYRVDTDSLVARITPAYGESWPTTRLVTNAVEVDFTAGYGDSPEDVPPPIRHAVKVLVATWYDPARASVVIGTTAARVPMTVDYLLGPYRVIDRE